MYFFAKSGDISTFHMQKSIFIHDIHVGIRLAVRFGKGPFYFAFLLIPRNKERAPDSGPYRTIHVLVRHGLAEASNPVYNSASCHLDAIK